jgi:CO/xanthine dehydrogenase FAD-binding subunit
LVEYLFPRSVEEAIRFLESAAGDGRIIAGGTDLLPDIRKNKIRPHCLVDITRIPDLAQIRVTAEYVEIGAAVTFAALKDSPFLNQHVQALTDAARSVGALAIQNAATWVGNLVQAMPAADGAIIALALEAEACVMDGNGPQWWPVESLFLGPGASTIDPTRQLITHLRFPRPTASTGTAWRRAGRRPSLVLPTLNCAVKLSLEATFEKTACVPTGTASAVPPAQQAARRWECRWPARIERATIALGPVAPHPFRARQAETFLRGKPPIADVFEQAAYIVQQEANPRDSVVRASRAYRLSILPTLVLDALVTAAQRAQDVAPERGSRAESHLPSRMMRSSR